MKLRIKVKNTGSMAGVAIWSSSRSPTVATPVVEDTVSTPELGIQEVSDWVDITLAPFAAQTTGMYYVISLNGSSESIYDGSQSQWADVFNVKVQAEEDSGNLLLIVILLVAVIGVLGTLVFVLARRGGGGSSMLDDEYEDDEDEVAYGESKVLAEIPADVDPEMARAMETFPQWTQQEIKATLTKGGPLNRSKIGSTISEWNPCLPRDGPMRSGKTRTAAPWSFTAPCRRSSIPTLCDLASRGTALHYWSPQTWLISGCKKKRTRLNLKA